MEGEAGPSALVHGFDSGEGHGPDAAVHVSDVHAVTASVAEIDDGGVGGAGGRDVRLHLTPIAIGVGAGGGAAAGLALYDERDLGLAIAINGAQRTRHGSSLGRGAAGVQTNHRAGGGVGVAELKAGATVVVGRGADKDRVFLRGGGGTAAWQVRAEGLAPRDGGAAAGVSERGVEGPGSRREEALVVVGVEFQRDADLAEVGRTVGGASRLADAADSRDEDRGQDADDRDNGEQLDQGEGAARRTKAGEGRVHGGGAGLWVTVGGF